MKDLTIEELATIAKEAQAKYDKAVHERNKAKSKSPKGTIVATSTDIGFEWDCNADQNSVIRHTVATITSAMDTLKEQPLVQLELVMKLMEELKAVALKS